MIYKDSDNKMPVVAMLMRMLALAKPEQRALVERELAMLRAGMATEREAAALIDLYLKNSTRTAVLHDLRLVSQDGDAVQIDHLLVQRSRRFYLLDTKYFSQGLKITEDGDFLRWNDAIKGLEPIPSPLDALARQVSTLRDALEPFGLDDAPIDTLVLLAPNARIERPRRFSSARVMKVDQFMEKLNDGRDAAAQTVQGYLNRASMSDSIADIAHKLIALHRPTTAATLARFGLRGNAAQTQAQDGEGGAAAQAAQASVAGSTA